MYTKEQSSMYVDCKRRLWFPVVVVVCGGGGVVV